MSFSIVTIKNFYLNLLILGRLLFSYLLKRLFYACFTSLQEMTSTKLVLSKLLLTMPKSFFPRLLKSIYSFVVASKLSAIITSSTISYRFNDVKKGLHFDLLVVKVVTSKQFNNPQATSFKRSHLKLQVYPKISWFGVVIQKIRLFKVC